MDTVSLNGGIWGPMKVVRRFAIDSVSAVGTGPLGMVAGWHFLLSRLVGACSEWLPDVN